MSNCYIILCVPLTAVIPILLDIVLISKKFRNKINLKKCCLVGFFIFTALSVLFDSFNYNETIIRFLVGNFGGGIMVVCNQVQAFCFAGGIPFLVTYIILAVRTKIRSKKTDNIEGTL